jgi:hypothetical protein
MSWIIPKLLGLLLEHSSNADENSYTTLSRRLRCTAQLLERSWQLRRVYPDMCACS